MKDIDENPTVLTLCGSQNNENCPIVTISKSEVSITDDFGGQVHITIDQFRLLIEKVEQFKFE